MTSQPDTVRPQGGGRETRLGFSVIELLVVVSLIMILATFALRSMTGSTIEWAVRGATNEFVNRHELARATAIRFGRTSLLRVDTVARTFWVEVDTSFQLTGVRDTIGNVEELADDDVAISASRVNFCFDGRGVPSTALSGCSAAAATLRFSKQGFTDSVTVSVLGKVMR